MSVSTVEKDAQDSLSSPIETLNSTATVVENAGSGIDEKRLVRRIDCRVLPFLFAVYFMAFIDKVLLNYAFVMGMPADLGMSQATFMWLGTGFYLGYGIAELGQGPLIQIYPVNKVLAINILLWGVATAGVSAVQNDRQLLALRTLLGVFESVMFPALMMVTSSFYKKSEAVARFGVWISSIGVGQIIGGLVSYTAQMCPAKMQSWRIMFLVVGVANILFSGLVLRMPSAPEECGAWLPEEEIRFALQRLRDDNAGVGVKRLRKRSVVEVLLDAQTWLLFILATATVLPAGIIVYFSATIIMGYGYDSEQATLLNMPSGVVTVAATLTVTFIVSQEKIPRWTTLMMCTSISLLGVLLTLFLKHQAKVGTLLGIYLISSTIGSYALTLAITSANFSGYTRKLVSSVLIGMAYSLANLIAPQTFRPLEAPRYHTARVVIAIAMAIAIVDAVLLRLLYGHRNARADRNNEPAMSKVEKDSVRNAAGGSLDFANRSFRYVL